MGTVAAPEGSSIVFQDRVSYQEPSLEARDTANSDGIEASDTTRPRPMNVEESEWDREGDCLSLTEWKVNDYCIVYSNAPIPNCHSSARNTHFQDHHGLPQEVKKRFVQSCVTLHPCSLCGHWEIDETMCNKRGGVNDHICFSPIQRRLFRSFYGQDLSDAELWVLDDRQREEYFRLSESRRRVEYTRAKRILQRLERISRTSTLTLTAKVHASRDGEVEDSTQWPAGTLGVAHR